MFLLQLTSGPSCMKSQWAGWCTLGKNHKMFILIKLRYVNINMSFFFFLLYNNESHFVITKYCYNALYSHYCLQSYFKKHHLIHDCYHIDPVSILLIICISNKYCCSVFLRQSIVNKWKEKRLHLLLADGLWGFWEVLGNMFSHFCVVMDSDVA